jgi:hypothetical protein
MNRTSRRHIERQLRKLYNTDNCSICGSPFRHNSRTRGGIDVQGAVVLAGECCVDKVAVTFTEGFYSKRAYDFLKPRGPKSTACLSSEQITEVLGLYQEIATDTDKRLEGVERRGGVARALDNISVLDTPWKDGDRSWFEQNRQRSHRIRMPFPGEADKEAAKAPPGHALIVLLRQVEPGKRIKGGFCLNADLLPVPDDEAVAHALFEVAARHETVPRNGEALNILIAKYTVDRERGQ